MLKQERFEQVHQLHQAGLSKRAIAAQVNLSRRTVQKYIALDSYPPYSGRVARPGKLTPWVSYLEQRWLAGCTNATRLWREIEAQGYTGRRGLVARWAANEITRPDNRI